MTKKVLFEVECVVSPSGGGAIVFAKRTNDVDFYIKPGQALNGCEILEGSIPRAHHEDGTPRLDLWGFRLKSDADAACFSVGYIVELSQ